MLKTCISWCFLALILSSLAVKVIYVSIPFFFGSYVCIVLFFVQLVKVLPEFVKFFMFTAFTEIEEKAI